MRRIYPVALCVAAAVVGVSSAPAVAEPVGPNLTPAMRAEEFVERVAGLDVVPVPSRLTAILNGVAITAPDNQTFRTDSAMIAVLEPGQMAVRFGLPDDVVATVLPEGAVLLQRSSDNYTAQLEAPWAKDATGQSLRTSYSVDGAGLVQNVDVSGATYPIAADPTLGHSWGIPTLYLNRSETSRARSASYAGWICGFIPFPGSIFCAANIANVTRSATLAYQHHKCVKFLVGPGALSGQDYTGGNCK